MVTFVINGTYKALLGWKANEKSKFEGRNSCKLVAT
jgi:hypothetical protein